MGQSQRWHSRLKMTLQDRLNAHLDNLPNISLLKIDTEGHELPVFRDALESIRANKIDAIKFEFNEMNVISPAFFKDFFNLLNNYLLIRLPPMEECQSRYTLPLCMRYFPFKLSLDYAAI